MAKNWKKIEEREVFKTPYFSIDAKKYSDGTGYVDDFYCFKFTDWVHVIPILPSGEFLMVEQFRFGSEQISLEFPGGQLGKGEQPEFTARRELTEETGYIANSMTLLGSSYPNPATHDNKCWYFLARDLTFTGSQTLDQAEDINIKILKEAELKKLIKDQVISHSLAVVCYQYYQLSL